MRPTFDGRTFLVVTVNALHLAEPQHRYCVMQHEINEVTILIDFFSKLFQRTCAYLASLTNRIATCTRCTMCQISLWVHNSGQDSLKWMNKIQMWIRICECEYITCPWQYNLLLCLFNLFLGNVVRNASEYVGGLYRWKWLQCKYSYL